MMLMFGLAYGASRVQVDVTQYLVPALLELGRYE